MTQTNPYDSYNHDSQPKPQTYNDVDNSSEQNIDENVYNSQKESVQQEPLVDYSQDYTASEYTNNDPYSNSSASEAAQYNVPENSEYHQSQFQNGQENSSYNNSLYNDSHGQYKNQFATAPQLNILALLGLVFSFMFAPIGLVLSIMGFAQAKKDPNDSAGKVMSLIGMIVAGLQIAILVLYILFIIIMVFFSAAS